jgi:protein O-mannosyl-transferase
MTFRLWGRCLILCLLVSLVYINSFSGVFQFDDFKVIVNYARAHSFASWLYYFSHNIRPLLKLSYTFNWTSGEGLFGFHLFNLSVHVINTLLVYLISLRFFSSRGYLLYTNAAFITALLFGLHPVQTEAVTYITGRSVSLMAMFYLAAMLAYIYGEEKNKGLLTYVTSPIFFVLAVLTRETALTLPAALLLWDATKRDGRWAGAFRRTAVHWGLLILMLGAIIIHMKYKQLLDFSYDLRGVKENLLSQFNGLGYLLSRLVMMNKLNIDPDVPVFSSWTAAVVLKAILILSVLATGLITFKKNRLIGFGILWFFLHLAPTNSIVPRLDIANERHMYLPVFGIFLIVGMGIEKLRANIQSRRWLVNAGVAAILIILSYFTWARNNDYRSEVALWEDTVKNSPNKARCYNNLGYAYELEGRYVEAKTAYTRASQIDPDFDLAKNNLKKVEALEEKK